MSHLTPADLLALNAKAKALAKRDGIKLARALDLIAKEAGRPYGISCWPLLAKMVNQRQASADPLIAWYWASQAGDTTFLSRYDGGAQALLKACLERPNQERLLREYGLEAMAAMSALANYLHEEPLRIEKERRQASLVRIKAMLEEARQYRAARGIVRMPSLGPGSYVVIATPADIQALTRNEINQMLERTDLFACADIAFCDNDYRVAPPPAEDVFVTTRIVEVAKFVRNKRFVVFNRASLDNINQGLSEAGQPQLDPELAVFVADRAYAVGEAPGDDIYYLGFQGGPSLDLPSAPERVTPEFTISWVAKIMSFINKIECETWRDDLAAIEHYQAQNVW